MSERVLQAVPISLVVCDEDGRVLSANSEFYRTFSLTEQDFEKRRLPEVLELGSLAVDGAAGLRGESTFQGPWTWESNGGGVLHFYVSINPLPPDGDESRRVIIALQNVTDRISAENRYQQLMENANDGVFVIDATTGKIQEANSRAVRPLLYD